MEKGRACGSRSQAGERIGTTKDPLSQASAAFGGDRVRALVVSSVVVVSESGAVQGGTYEEVGSASQAEAARFRSEVARLEQRNAELDAEVDLRHRHRTGPSGMSLL
jgi:hypothetical protein